MPTVLVLVLHPSDPPGPLAGWLADAGVEVDVRAVVPESLAGVDGLVVLGGPQNANDPELAPLRALLREAVAAEVPTLGICLGAQALAVAHGGRVEPSPECREIGAQLVAKRTAASTDPLFGARPITPDVIQWHFDAITVLPPGAVHLASSPTCEHQAFRLGRFAWGLQFHIETTPDLVRSWAIEDTGLLDGYDLDGILRRSDRAHADVAEVWQPFVRGFADIVRDPASVPAPSDRTGDFTDPAAVRAALAREASAARAPMPMPVMRPPDDD